jgi:hypothetical protein
MTHAYTGASYSITARPGHGLNSLTLTTATRAAGPRPNVIRPVNTRATDLFLTGARHQPQPGGARAEAAGERHQARGALAARADAGSDAGHLQAHQQAARRRPQQDHQLHNGRGGAHRDGGVRGHLHGARRIRGGPGGQHGAGEGARRGQHLPRDGLRHLLRVRLRVALHLAGRSRGADLRRGHRAQGQEADDGRDQQAHVGGVHAHQRRVPRALVRRRGAVRAVAGRGSDHHGRHHPGHHHRDHALLGHRAPDGGQADPQHETLLAQPIPILLMLRRIGR